ncbi:MAG TPA: hypothetical protein VFB86_00960 [Bacteroidales bacterium]|nr:hypothetical protein [Bacteroidales bacterium]
MKKVIASMLVLFMGIIVSAQDLQQATTKGAIRLFGDKDDLTTVIQLIPDGSTVEVIKSDTLYSLVRFEEVEGYVKSDRLDVSKPVISVAPVSQPQPYAQPQQPQAAEDQQYETQPEDRYAALVAKYGTDIGKRLYQNKVWKGVTSDMAIDSWGRPKQINRMYVDQSVDEEWIYSKKWLYFRDGILIEWGAVK